jgi:integrase
MERILNGEPPIQQGRRTDKHPLALDGRALFCVRAHDLRHTFCTMLYSAGVDVKSAAYFMGHSDVRVTMEVYTHLSQERRAQSGEMIVGYLDSFREKKHDPEPES